MANQINYYYGTGRRKSSRARVFLTKGSGQITVNGRSFDDYFPQEGQRIRAKQPLRYLGAENEFDCFITVRGGGPSGQAGAILLGIARALTNHESQNEMTETLNWRSALKQAGYLTRDSRQVERKKVGKRKARRGTQYSKR